MRPNSCGPLHFALDVDEAVEVARKLIVAVGAQRVAQAVTVANAGVEVD